MRRLLVLSAIIVLILTFAGWESAGAQNGPAVCPPPTELGVLSDVLTASGTWSPESRAQCGTSQFLDNRPGTLYRFTLAAEAEVRIDLSSSDRDAVVYLQAEDGTLIDSNDDTGGEGDARIERSLPAGTYGIEASAFGWSGRETGSFELTLRIVSGCDEVVDLGVLEETLDAEAVWTHFGCESDFRPDRSSQRYRFELGQTTRIRIDLTSDLADSYVYLLDSVGTLLDSDDDGGVGFNSRIVRVLGAGTYIIEATNWGDRDLKNLQEAGYRLSIAREEDGPIIKLETIEAPDRVVLGLPFDIHYRVGNLGEAALSTTNGSVQVRVRWPYISDWQTSRIDSGDGDTERWDVGASYHTEESLAAFGSESLPQLHPFEGLYQWRYGPTDVMLEVLVFNEEGDSVAGHRLSRPVMVLSGIEFDPVNVSVDGVEYEVGAIADEEGLVTTEVTPVTPASGEPAVDDEQTDEEEDLDPEIRSRAIYAAGVRTQVLNDFSSAIESLSATTDSLFALVPRGGMPISEAQAASAPTLDALVEALSAAHSEVLMRAGFDSQQFQSVDAAEEIVVLAGRAAARRIEQFTRDWGRLADPDHVLTSDEALNVHAQLAYAERVDARLVDAAVLVMMKRAAEQGWSDPDVEAALEAFADEIDCDADGELSFSDDALRELSPAYGFMLDRAYCGAVSADEDHDQLLSGLDLSVNPVIPVPEIVDEPTPAPSVAASRLLARVRDDGRIEFGVDLSNGERALPVQRLLPVDTAEDVWLRTAPITSGEVELGRIYVRRLSVGLVQTTYVPIDGSRATSSRWIVPVDAPVGAWLVSGELERGPGQSGDDLVQRVGDQAAGAGTAQFGDHLSLLALIENNLQRNP